MLHRNLKLKIMKKTDEALGKLIEKGIEVAEQTGKFVIDQAPELIQQFYTWHIVQNVLGILIGLLFLFFSYKIIFLMGKEEENWSDDINIFNRWIGFGTAIISCISVLFGLIFTICSVYELVFILVAPKLYLIEYFVR